MQTLNDFSRSRIALEPNGTLIAVIEMSLSSWLVAGILPGVERQPLKKLAVDESAETAAAMAGGSRESRTQDRAHCSRLRGRPRRFLASALAQGTQHRGPRHSRSDDGRRFKSVLPSVQWLTWLPG